MAKTETKKVGGGEKAEKAEKKGREPFAVNTAVNAEGASVVNSDGKLTSVPENWSNKDHKPLKRDDFASDDVFLDFRAKVAEIRAARYTKDAQRYHRKAERLRTFGDEATRKAVTKLEKYQTEMAKLIEQMQKDGHDVGKLMESLKAEAPAEQE